jgi:hypothetical protein
MSFAYYYKPNMHMDYHLQQTPYYYSNQPMNQQAQPERIVNLSQQYNTTSKKPGYGLSHTVSKVANIPSIHQSLSTAFISFSNILSFKFSEILC